MNGNKKINQPPYQRKPVDELTKETYSWLGRIFVFIKKNKIRTWHLIFIGAYLVGALSTLIFTASFELYPTSQATGETATLALSPATKSVYLNDSFTLDLIINTTTASPGHKVVVAKAVVNFDPNTFELLSADTTTSSFVSGNTCIYNSKPCEIIKSELGKVTITLAKPTPGVTISSASPAKMAVLNFRAKALVTPASNNITISFTSGSYTDSDVIFDNGLGTDILTGVTNAKVTVTPVSPTNCSDGTPLNTCSTTKPLWCDGSGNLINNQCGPAQHNCGCPAGLTCQTDGSCSSPTCTPNGCNANCPSGCTVAQDPDCACQGGNSCCGIGCTNANDSDCSPIINITLTPVSTIVNRGSQLKYSATLTNNTSQSQTFKAARLIYRGTSLLQQTNYTVTFGANQTSSYNLSLDIPSTTPVGDYILRIAVGTSWSNIYDSDQFNFSVK